MGKKPTEGKKRVGGEAENRLRGREGVFCVCVCEGGGSIEEGHSQYAEVTDDLSQSLQLSAKSHGLQLESPDTTAQKEHCITNSVLQRKKRKKQKLSVYTANTQF